MKIIDLSMALYTNMETYPGDPQVEINVVHSHEKHTWEVRRISMGSHSGSHVDAYSHMHRDRESLDDIPLSRFFGESQVVKLQGKWPRKKGLFFIEEIGIEYLNKIIEHDPGFVGGNISEDLERGLLGNNIITYTGLINLEAIPEGETFMFYGLPLRIRGGDGSPVRAIAIME